MSLSAQQRYRQKLIDRIGIEEYRRLEREKRQARRTTVQPTKDEPLTSTQKIHLGTYNKILKLMKIEEITDYKPVIDFINTKYKNINTKANNLFSVGVILRNMDNKNYQKFLDEGTKYRNVSNKKAELNEKSNKEIDNWMDWKDVKKVYKNKALSNYEKAMVGIFTLLPPRRVGILRYLKYGKDSSPDFNWYNGKHMYLNRYKTVKTYGSVKIIMPKPVRLLLETLNLKEGEYIFTRAKGTPYGDEISTVFQDIFEKATNKRISTNILRHIYITEQLKKNLTIRQKKTLSKKLGHNHIMMEKYNRV